MIIMRLPALSSSYRQRVRFGRYVARRLRRAKLMELSTSVVAITAELREAGRSWEDKVDAVQEALADRDAADDELDAAAKSARVSLAGRSVSAAREQPYLSIFPRGIGYYIGAPIGKEIERYEELKQRLAEHLPATDPVRGPTIAAIEAGLGDYAAARKALGEANTAEAIARTHQRQTTDAWARQLERTYGALVADLGRSRANSYFPRSATRAVRGGGEEATSPQDEAGEG